MAHRFGKKLMILGLSAVLTASAFAAVLPSGMTGGVLRAQAAETIDGHRYLAENSGYRLYVNEDDLSLVVEDKETGKYLESSISYDDGKNNDIWLGAMKSAVVLTLINKNDDTLQADIVNDDVRKNVTFTNDGFSAELYWNKYQIGLTLNVSLSDKGLVAQIPESSIREDGSRYYIGTVRIYPFMGNSYLDEKEGYMLVPDGNGALIYLDDKDGRFAAGFSGTIYGTDIGFEESKVETLLWDRYNTISDAEKVLAPIYGIAHTDDGIAFLGIVEDGADRAAIEVTPNGASVDYNRAGARFVLRRLYTQPTSNNSTSGSLHIYEDERSHSDLQVRFLFLSGDRATYAGMANAYRDYLLDTERIRQQDTSFKTRVDFLGTERQNWVLGTQAVVMTTTDDIREIYSDLSSLGVTDLLSVYKGWQKGGLYNLPITKYRADSAIGGTGDLTKLIKESAQQGIELYLYDNALLINPDENNATFNVIKQVNKRRYQYDTYMDVYEQFYYLTPTRSRYLLERFVKDYQAEGIANLCVAGITNTAFTYTYRTDKFTRFDTTETYASTLDAIAEQTNLILEQPIAKYWKDTSAFLDMPLYTSSYMLEDESVPFLSIALQGILPVYADYVNFEANEKEFFLKMVESGAFPSFYITQKDSSELIYTNSSNIYSSQYATYRDRIAEYSASLGELRSRTAGSTISDHQISGDMRCTTYSNGVKVYVNYGAAAQSMDGVSVEPLSYVIR